MLEDYICYEPVFDQFCLRACILNILRYYQVKHAFLYINSSLDFRAITDPRGGIRIEMGLEPLTGSLQEQYMRHHMDNLQKIWETYHISVQDTPIIIEVDGFELPYHPLYRKEHIRHTCIICGYNLLQKQYRVIDWLSPYFFKGNVDYGILQQAFQGNWITIKRNGWTQSAFELYKQTISACYFKFCRPADCITGIQAVYKLKELAINFSPEKTELRYLHTQVSKIIAQIRLLRHFLAEASETIPIPPELCGFLDTLLKKWRKATTVLLKNIYSSKSSKDYRPLLSYVFDEMQLLVFHIQKAWQNIQ